MKARTIVLLAGVGAGLGAPFLKKAAIPLSTYLVGGSIIAYETACDLVEFSGDLVASCVHKIGTAIHPDILKQRQAEHSGPGSV